MSEAGTEGQRSKAERQRLRVVRVRLCEPVGPLGNDMFIITQKKPFVKNR